MKDIYYGLACLFSGGTLLYAAGRDSELYYLFWGVLLLGGAAYFLYNAKENDK